MALLVRHCAALLLWNFLALLFRHVVAVFPVFFIIIYHYYLIIIITMIIYSNQRYYILWSNLYYYYRKNLSLLTYLSTGLHSCFGTDRHFCLGTLRHFCSGTFWHFWRGTEWHSWRGTFLGTVLHSRTVVGWQCFFGTLLNWISAILKCLSLKL